MALGFKITPKFKPEDVGRALQDFQDRVQVATLSLLIRIGEDCVADARARGNYKNRSGNLRNSIGYVVLYNGAVYAQGFNKVVSGGNKGVEAARKALEAELGGPFIPKKGLCLIVVAGMDYAVYVEANGYNVLTSSAKRAEKKIIDGLASIGTKIQKVNSKLSKR